MATSWLSLILPLLLLVFHDFIGAALGTANSANCPEGYQPTCLPTPTCPPTPTGPTKKPGEGQFMMWVRPGSHKPMFVAVEPSVNPLPECLNRAMSNINGTGNGNDFFYPGYLTLPDGSPVVCEGRRNGGFNGCFKFNMNKNEWSYHSTTLMNSRIYGFYDFDPRVGFVIAGGSASARTHVEISRDFGVTFQELAPLPAPDYLGRIVILNEKTVLFKPLQRQQLYLLDLESNTWSEGPKLKTNRHGVALGVVTRPSGEKELVFYSGSVKGGETPHDISSCGRSSGITMTSEIYNIANNTLRDGKTGNIGIYAGMTIQYMDTFLVMGGNIQEDACGGAPKDGSIYRYNMDDGSFTKMEAKLPGGRSAYFDSPPLWVDDHCN